MDSEGIRGLLVDVLGPAVRIEKKGEWLMTRCPFAPWLHSSGQDNNPSFGVHINDDGPSICNCFTCKVKGPLVYFLRRMEQYTGESYRQLRDSIDNEETYLSPLPEYGSVKQSRSVKLRRRPTVVDEVMVELYDGATVDHPYLIERGLTNQEAIDEMGLLIDPEDTRGFERLLFPVRGIDGTLHGFSGRATAKGVEPRVKDYFGLSKAALILGAHLIRPEDPYVCLVEGLVDYAVGRSHGFPALAVMHSSLTEEQRRILLEIGKPVYLFFDNDQAGYDGTEDVAEMLWGHLPVMFVTYPEQDDDDYAERGELDPAKLTADEWQTMIDTAELCS